MLGARLDPVRLVARRTEPATGDHELGAVHRVAVTTWLGISHHAEAPARLDGEGAKGFGCHCQR